LQGVSVASELVHKNRCFVLQSFERAGIRPERSFKIRQGALGILIFARETARDPAGFIHWFAHQTAVKVHLSTGLIAGPGAGFRTQKIQATRRMR
jgi:hypothetical protein